MTPDQQLTDLRRNLARMLAEQLAAMKDGRDDGKY